MKQKESFKTLCEEWGIALLAVVFLTMVCNIVGYGGRFLESIPGMLILCLISFLGLTAKQFIPSKLPAVTYIGIIGMLAAMPASPISGSIPLSGSSPSPGWNSRIPPFRAGCP